MSQLDMLLAGERTPGVYQWASAPALAKAKAVVEAASWRFVALETATVVDKAGLLDAVAKTFGFPAYYGRSVDAFAESLTDVQDDHGVLVWWEGWAGLAALNPQTTTLALEVFATRAADAGSGTFAVILAGTGPALDVPAFE